MSGIFISYRREDTEPYAGRLRDALRIAFGADMVFRDIDRINPGERFPQVIERAVGSCDALLAVIGPKWLTIEDEDHRRRLDNPKDYVRQEIAAALRRDDVVVIPVLVARAEMPGYDELPEPLAVLSEYNGVRISEEGWEDQITRLIKTLEPVVRRDESAPAGPLLGRSGPPHERPAWEIPPTSSWEPSVPQASSWQPPRPEPAPPPPSPQPTGSRSGIPTAAVIGAVALVVVAALGFGVIKMFSGFFENFGPGNPTVVLSPTSGPPGSTVAVTGTGYGKDETIDLKFHATEVGTTVAASDGSFTAQITIPDTPFRNQQFDISAIGKSTIRHDSAPFMVL